MWGVARTGAQFRGGTRGWRVDPEASRQIRVLDSNLHRGHFQFLLKLFGFSWDRQDCFVCWEYSANVCRFPLSFSPVPFLP